MRENRERRAERGGAAAQSRADAEYNRAQTRAAQGGARAGAAATVDASAKPAPSGTAEEERLSLKPIIAGSPWHVEHVEVLEQYIGNFRAYAENCRCACPFDLMLVAICCGREELAKLMWRHCKSPIRVALLANHFLRQIRKTSTAHTEELGQVQREGASPAPCTLCP